MSNPPSQEAEQVIQDRCCSENGREVKDQEDGPILHLHDDHVNMQTGPDVGKSLCFRRLNFVSTPESREGDIWHMVQHMRGIRHFPSCWRPKPSARGAYGESLTAVGDPVGHSIKRIAVMDNYEPLNKDEAAQFEQLLRYAYHGDLQAVEASFDTVKQLRDPKLNPLQPVGTIAAVMGHHSVVQFVFNKGASMDRDLALAIRKGSRKNTEMKEFYEKNSKMLSDLIDPKPDPNYKPNVPDELRQRWDERHPR